MVKRVLNRNFVSMLALWMTIISAVPSNAFAFPSQSLSALQPASLRDVQISRIMDVLSRPEAQVRLHMMGIDPKKAKNAVSGLDDAQLAQLAGRAEAVQAGGDGLGLVIGILVVVLLVVLIINLMNKKIEIKDQKK